MPQPVSATSTPSITQPKIVRLANRGDWRSGLAFDPGQQLRPPRAGSSARAQTPRPSVSSRTIRHPAQAAPARPPRVPRHGPAAGVEQAGPIAQHRVAGRLRARHSAGAIILSALADPHAARAHGPQRRCAPVSRTAPSPLMRRQLALRALRPAARSAAARETASQSIGRSASCSISRPGRRIAPAAA